MNRDSSFPNALSRGAAWADLERALVAVVLEEATVAEALERMAAAFRTHLGVEASVLDGHQPASAAQDARILLGSAVDGTDKTLVLANASIFDDAERARFKRLYEALIQAGHPLSRSAALLHKLRNRLAALQANVEYAEMIATEGPSPNDDLVVALKHAMTACREISTTLGAIEEQQRSR